MTERCGAYRTERDIPEDAIKRDSFDALYRCVYHQGHDGPHWQYGTKWMLDLDNEVRRLREVLLWFAITPTGIPGHAVAVGCPHPREAADLLDITGMTSLDEARTKIGTTENADAKAALQELHDAEIEKWRERYEFTPADSNERVTGRGVSGD